jgi:phosphoribosylaminoimidazolecarboxamide formyltransferase/IMP cyclohydrolase
MDIKPFFKHDITQRYALLSCYDKTGLGKFAISLILSGYRIISTGGTYQAVSEALHARGLGGEDTANVIQVSAITGFPEILNGRVKTLHPLIHGALLTDWDNPDHVREAKAHGFPRIEIVAVSLYPFWEITTETSPEDAIEMIDIGGVAMIRAAAKNHKHIAVLTSPKQYRKLEARKTLALAAFELTSNYDRMISNYFRGGADGSVGRRYELVKGMKYGCNSHQSLGAGVYSVDGKPVPLKLLNGEWGYINVLDAMGCWALVMELHDVTGHVAACSFKHTSPAGAAIAWPFELMHPATSELLEKLYKCSASTPPALNAYMRARNADPMSSFGDFIGISCEVTADVAKFIAKQISDGIVAPGYTPEALEILKRKKKGRYVIVQSDPTIPLDQGLEFREMCGLAVAQPCNTRVIDNKDLTNVVSAPSGCGGPDVLDMKVANVCLKYAQSNNVACAYQGQLVGLSAGQQSRVHSTRLACDKALVWKRRHHPANIALLSLFRTTVKMQSKINATTRLAEDPGNFMDEHRDLLRPECMDAARFLVDSVVNKKAAFNPPLTMASDAFFPFPDSIHAAHRAGVAYISQPGGSTRDDEVTEACNQHGICMVHTGVRIFTH